MNTTEIVDEARPLSGFFRPTHADYFVYGNAFLIMKLSKLPNFKVIRALIMLIASQSMCAFLFYSFVPHFTQVL